MLDWILERLGLVIFVVIIITQIIRGLFRSRRDTPTAQAKPDELEAQRREQEIQEDIRRRRAQRRAAQTASEPPPLATPEPAARTAPAPETTQMPEPFGGPLRRVLEELEREVKTHTAPTAPPALPLPAPVERRNAEVERQERLAEEMRMLKETRTLVQRRAAHIAADKAADAQSEPALRSAARGRLLDDLRDPASLRRAFVLREVLGPPVGLR